MQDTEIYKHIVFFTQNYSTVFGVAGEGIVCDRICTCMCFSGVRQLCEILLFEIINDCKFTNTILGIALQNRNDKGQEYCR